MNRRATSAVLRIALLALLSSCSGVSGAEVSGGDSRN